MAKQASHETRRLRSDTTAIPSCIRDFLLSTFDLGFFFTHTFRGGWKVVVFPGLLLLLTRHLHGCDRLVSLIGH